MGIGAGGHAKVLIETLWLAGLFEVWGLLAADPIIRGNLIMGIPVRGDDTLLPEIWKLGIRHAFMGIGSIRPDPLRRELFDRAQKVGLEMIQVIHPTAVISTSALLGHGTVVMAGAIINAGAQIGDNVIVNTAAVIEHDCMVGDHAHVATGAVLAGGVRVLPGAHIGAGATVRQGITVHAAALVGAGAVVVRDVPPGVVVVGNPARALQGGLHPRS